MKIAKSSVLVIGGLAAIMLAVSLAARLPGQGGGSRAGVYPGPSLPAQGLAASGASFRLDNEAIQNFITVVGSAEVRVKPTSIRIIIALTSQGATAEECMRLNAEKEKALTKALAELAIGEDKIFIDFIAMLPVYEWTEEQREGSRYQVENLSGHLVQTNVHIEVGSESEARAAVRAAFQLGITDIISFDYWCDSLDDHKREAQQRALAEAQRKADMLLSAHFQQDPKPLNIHEQTEVVYPKSLYESFENVHAQSLERNYRRQSLPAIRAFRPKNTHYRGYFAGADSQDRRLPMEPEISVIATISCYYAVPEELRQEGVKNRSPGQ